jgi:pSer/pThr/pTyr-binding forkhead associated (FHA) protein
MVKLVIQTQSMMGRSHELNVDCTTIGRVEDNLFQIADPSVSSHHCEAHLRDGAVVIRDLNSTNGTFINDAQITESVLKPGQTLRLGQIELKLETGAGSPGPAPAPATPAAPPAPAAAAASKRPLESTMVMPRGISLSDLESGGRKPGPDTATGSKMFSKKRNIVGQYFWIAAGIVIVIIIGLIFFIISQASNHH